MQPCILHSCEAWSLNKETVGSLHGWESRNLHLMSSRKWIKRGLFLEWFRANQIRMARKRFAEGGGESVEWLMPQRIWGFWEKIFHEKSTKQTGQMMREIPRHADPFWRDQRSTNARLLGPRNQKMKRRRASVVHTNWDSPMTRWSGCQRWWESCKGREKFVKVAEELCKRALKREENKGDTGLEQK